MTQGARIGAGARIAPRLGGVPETLLWPLRSRAGMTVLDRGFFDDPMAVDLLNRIDYDFDRFGPVSHWHAVRSKYSDGLIRRYLARHPRRRFWRWARGWRRSFGGSTTGGCAGFASICPKASRCAASFCRTIRG